MSIVGKPITLGGSGGKTVSRSAVNFYDYDGTVVASYTAAEFADLSALPQNPSHAGLTAQGWNWTLADAKTYVATYGKLEVGQMYVTADGKTRIYIHLEEGRLSPYLGIAINGMATVEWGDESTSTVTGSDISTVVNTQHTYASAGDYVIAISVNGSMSLIGSGHYGSELIWNNSATSNANKTYQSSICAIEIGSNLTSIGEYAFYSCYGLKYVTIPSSVTSIEYGAFEGCSSLSSVAIPNNAAEIGIATFESCTSLLSVTIPNSITSIDSYAFYNCTSLLSVTIPSSITSIESHAFDSCFSLSSVTIPSSITSIPADFVRSCYRLSSVTIPSSVTEIVSGAFDSCYSLASLTIPSNVTRIGGSAFSNCGFGEIHFLSSTPPTVENSNAWKNIPTDCIIYIPSGSRYAYTRESNYPSASTYTYVEE